MFDDKRKGEKPVPDDIERHLNEAQLAELRTIEGFGWKLKFIRRPVFQAVVVVVMSQDGTSIGVLEDDGRLSLDPDIKMRE